MVQPPRSGCVVRPSSLGPNVWIFDFDQASPGGRGGASILIDVAQGMASIAGVHKNALLPSRSTGGLLADGLRQVGMPRPTLLEGYNVTEPQTASVLRTGGSGQGTVLGNMLTDTVAALGGTITQWEPVWDGSTYHLRVHVAYP